MSAFTKCILLASLALSATALTTPLHHRNSHHHRALAAHIAVPAQIDVPIVAEQAPVAPRVSRKKRSNNVKRCQARPSSASASATAASAIAAPSAPINVAPGPILPSAPSSASAAATPSSQEPVTPSSQEPAAPPSPATSAPPAQTSSSSDPNSGSTPSFLVGTQTGQGTFYATGLGACGITNTDTDYIAAVSHSLFDGFPGYDGVNPNNNPICNKKVTANYGGKSVTVTITDRCTGCALTDLDFSPSAFDELADPTVGRIFGMTWNWD